MRAAWKLLLAYAAYLLWAWLATYALSWGFGALFDGWNLSAATIAQAPAWAQGLFANYGRLISVISSLGVAALSQGLLRLLAGGRMYPLRPVTWPSARSGGLSLCSLARRSSSPWIPCAPTGAPSPSRRTSSGCWPSTLPPRWPRSASPAASPCAWPRSTPAPFGAMWPQPSCCWPSPAATPCRRWASSTCCSPPSSAPILSATGHAGASVGLRCAWSWSSNALAAFPGGNAASQPVFRLYDVSENWLTGGANGLICGAWMTLILLALALWLFRQPLRALLRRKKAK